MEEESTLETFLKSVARKGIFHEITTAYSPESDGRAERLNRTFMYMARSMIIGTDGAIHDGLWAEAMNNGNHIRTQLLKKSSRKRLTPFEMLTTLRPDFSYMKLFGCAAYVHIPKILQHGNFSQRAQEGIFLGTAKVMPTEYS